MKNLDQEFDSVPEVVVLFQMEASKGMDKNFEITTVIIICFVKAGQTEYLKRPRQPRHYNRLGSHQKYRYEL